MKTVRKYNHIPGIVLVAIHLLRIAASQGVSRVELSNSCLRSMTGRSKRVSREAIRELAVEMAPIFPRHSIAHDHTGTRYTLVLFADVTDDANQSRKHASVSSIPKLADIIENLGVQPVSIETDDVTITSVTALTPHWVKA